MDTLVRKRCRPLYSSIKLLEYNILSCIPGSKSYNQGLGRIKYSGENRKIKSIRILYQYYTTKISRVKSEENISDGENPLGGKTLLLI